MIDNETSPPIPGAANPKGVGNRIWGGCKTILINVIVFCSLFVPFEFSYRVWTYFRSCNSICNITALTKLDAFEREHVYGFLASNSVTGFSPADGTFVIHEPGWNNATITIRGGVRVNTNFAPTSANGAILAVGDSFVFGDQVSDGETWPAILEKRLNRRVVNGGVSNYGAAQAVLRAEQLLKAEPYTLVILSILVGAEVAIFGGIGLLMVSFSIGPLLFERAARFVRRPSRRAARLFLITLFAIIHGFQNFSFGPTSPGASSPSLATMASVWRSSTQRRQQ